MAKQVVSNDGTGVLGWKFKRADEVEVGDYVFLILNTPVRVLAKFNEMVAGSGVFVTRFQIERPYKRNESIFVARLSHEMVVYEIREGPPITESERREKELEYLDGMSE